MHSKLPRPVWQALLLNFLLLLIVSTAVPATAQSGRRYTPRNPSSPNSTSPGGARSGSCTSGENKSLTALAPQSHVGQTAATHPTFVWYVPDSTSLPIDFRLYTYDSSGNLQARPVYQTELMSQPGIMTLTLPSSQPGLTVGQRYYWQAALICDPNHGSEDVIVSAEMTVVGNTLPEPERWYDLLESTLMKTNASSQFTVVALLSQLADLERTAAQEVANSTNNATANHRLKLQERSAAILQHSENLIQIIEAER
ncbi:MAG TPA: DUF928 domain-containing protein [Trichocoleus sp.]|jgi:hypothetical protein